MSKDSQLKNKIEIAAKRNKMNIMIQERPGQKLQRILQRSDPFSEKRCKRTDCMICVNDLGIDCRARGCVYQITCEECERIVGVKNKYRGQTSERTL